MSPPLGLVNSKCFNQPITIGDQVRAGSITESITEEPIHGHLYMIGVWSSSST